MDNASIHGRRRACLQEACSRVLYTRYREHWGYYISLYFRVWLRQQESGREAKGHKEVRTDLAIMGDTDWQCRQSWRPGRVEALLSHRKNWSLNPPHLKCTSMVCQGRSRKLVWQAFTRPYNKDQSPRDIHPDNRHIKNYNNLKFILNYLHFPPLLLTSF